jgi:hypothetical protein
MTLAQYQQLWLTASVTIFIVALLLFLPDFLDWIRGKGWGCRVGLHDWDGHTGPEYPAPRCLHCRTYHRRKKKGGK